MQLPGTVSSLKKFDVFDVTISPELLQETLFLCTFSIVLKVYLIHFSRQNVHKTYNSDINLSINI